MVKTTILDSLPERVELGPERQIFNPFRVAKRPPEAPGLHPGLIVFNPFGILKTC